MVDQDIKKLLDDIKELKPTVLCAVPRVLDKIYAGIRKHVLVNAQNIDLERDERR